MLGVPPSGEEILRGLAFLLAALAYAGVWLAAAMLFSVIFRSPATSALCALGLWLLFSILWPILVPFVVQIVAPSDSMLLLGIPSIKQIMLQQDLMRLSPSTLFGETMLALLHPTTRALGLVFPSQLQGAIAGTPLPFAQSVMLVWPQITGLVAAAILLFAASYVVFQRQEVRA
jgi:ABC-2 type transport system permease protein